MPLGRTGTSIAVLGISAVVLLGASPCSRNYEASRNCANLGVVVEAGGAAVLVPDCLGGGLPMEITPQEQISFTSVPMDLRATAVPVPASPSSPIPAQTLQISAIPAASCGTKVVRIHTEPLRGALLHQTANDYVVTVTVPAAGGGPCITPVTRYHVGGMVNGLSGNLVLRDNGTDDLAVSQDGRFVFPTPLLLGAHYSATVSTQPNGQNCTVSLGDGTVPAADVTDISVDCVNLAQRYTIGGTVRGLSGNLVLRDNGTDDLMVAHDGTFVFPTPLSDGDPYLATVSVQPDGQNCTVTRGNGTVVAADVTNISVDCTDVGPAPPLVTAIANPIITPTGGTTTLSAVVSGGVGPFEYDWYGYRDDGAPYSNTLSEPTAAQPTAGLTFPGSDFYFFVKVRDCGNPGGVCTVVKADVRVHEADDAVARFTVSPRVIHAGVTTVTFDASASTGIVTPVAWTLQYLGDVAAPPDIEGYLTLQANSGGTLFWNTTFDSISDLVTLDLDGANFPRPGAYRMLLQVAGDIGTHQTYEYFNVVP
jgi:hypothetical protein